MEINRTQQGIHGMAGSGYQADPNPAPTDPKPDHSADPTQINTLNSAIEKEQQEIKEVAKELKSAVMNGEKDKTQLLQNKINMKQQAIQLLRLRIDHIQEENGPTAAERPRFDRLTLHSDHLDPRIDSRNNLADLADFIEEN